MPGSDAKIESTWKYKCQKYGGMDVVCILIIGFFGVLIPTVILDDIEAWKQIIPGQLMTQNFTIEREVAMSGSSENDTNVTYMNVTYTAVSFQKDPSYDRKYVEKETIDSNQLFVISAIMPPIYIILYLYLLTFHKPPKDFKKWEKRWIWFEYVTFGYAFAISMSINYWMNKSLKILVSMPIPDFYGRCGLNTTNPYAPICENEDENEVFKSFKSFPSGHSSNLFTVGTLLVLYTWNKLNLFDTLKFELCKHRWYYRSFIDAILLWPIFLAAWGATTRVTDHVHTPTDILGGACLGYVAARVGYYTQYKHGSPWSYRLLMWPEIRSIIEKHRTLKRNMYPQLFKHRTNGLLTQMTKYSSQEKPVRGDGMSSQNQDKGTATEMTGINN